MSTRVRPAIATPDQIVGPGIDALVALRPRALKHINYGKGRYAHVFAGWRAQAALVLRRQADELAASHLSCGGEQLRDLAASEFEYVATTEPLRAVGEVTIARSGSMPAGTIRAGATFSKSSDPNAFPAPVRSAEYEVTQDVYVPQGQATVSLLLRAKSTGTDANLPLAYGATPTLIKPAPGALFDATFATTSCAAAGGSSGAPADATVRMAAQAYGTGKDGPTLDAGLAGALRSEGVRYVAILEDHERGKMVLAPADESWAYSAALARAVEQRLREDEWLGFGCELAMVEARVRYVSVAAAVTLRDSKYLTSYVDVTESIRKKIVAYFNERRDWYRWNAAALRAVVSAADFRIQSCSSVTVTDAVSGAAVADVGTPTFDTGPYSFTIAHHELVGAPTVTYAAAA